MPKKSSSDHISTRSRLKAAVAGAGAGIVGALAIKFVADAGAPVMVVTGWAPDGTRISVLEIVLTVAVVVALGAALLYALDRRGESSKRFALWACIAIAVALSSAVPLWRLDVDTQSKVALTLMHLWTGTACILALRWSYSNNASTVLTTPTPAGVRD